MMNDKDLCVRIIQKEFQQNLTKSPEKIRIGNQLVDDFIFDGNEAANIPINALRVIFNIISILGNEQFRPEDRPRQLSLFDAEYETQNNVFAAIKIRNCKISPSGSTKQVIDAYEFLAKFKMNWYKSFNSEGKEIKTFGGLISTPSYDKRGFTTFLVSSFWLKKLIVIPEYNYILYNVVYNIRNNKHIIFAIWLSKIPEGGTILKLTTINKKFGLNYKTSKDFCFKFLKSAKNNLDKFNSISFNYTYKRDLITIIPIKAKIISNCHLPPNAGSTIFINRRLNYFRTRYALNENIMVQFFHQYRNVPQTRELIEKAFKAFIKACRMKGLSSTNFTGHHFLAKIQEHLLMIYGNTKLGELFPNGYPVIT